MRWASFSACFVDDGFLEILNQPHDVAHAEHAARHAFGAEGLELVGRLAHAGEDDRRAGDFLHAERRATACVAVELGEHDAREAEEFVEALGRLDGVLADHGVDDEQDVAGVDGVLDRGELLHERLVDREATGGVSTR